MVNYKDKIAEKYKKILFIHGWGFTNKIWNNISDYFYLKNCIFLDLYTYIEKSDGDLRLAASRVLDDHKDIDLVVSWSLGCYLAKEIEFVAKFKSIKMVYISYTPKFIRTHKWKFGFEENTIAKLSKDLEDDKEKALKNFYLLILGDLKGKKNFYKDIVNNNNSIMDVSLENLNIGLDIIEKNNYNDFYKENASNLYIYGDKDDITSSSVANFIKELEPFSIIKTIPDSSHIPFLTNRDEFFKIIKEFI